MWTNPHYAGFIPMWIRDREGDSFVDQIHRNYGHGGGWHDFSGFELRNADKVGQACLEYPGDPAMREVSRFTGKAETLILFRSDWVAVVNNATGSYRVARID